MPQYFMKVHGAIGIFGVQNALYQRRTSTSIFESYTATNLVGNQVIALKQMIDSQKVLRHSNPKVTPSENGELAFFIITIINLNF